jgi:hypothetical protein
MSTTELKNQIIDQVRLMTDEVRLLELLELLRFQSDLSLYITCEDEKHAVMEARHQIVKGEVITDEEVQKEISEWLGK